MLCFFYDININDQILQVMFRELMRHMISFMDCPLFKKNGINYFYIFIIIYIILEISYVEIWQVI